MCVLQLNNRADDIEKNINHDNDDDDDDIHINNKLLSPLNRFKVLARGERQQRVSDGQIKPSTIPVQCNTALCS
eukprot:m.114395 g.114395  ORF g.114395 m.114395 type:complete len:74 (+) comp28346_c0_seq1:2067-2288(+)